MVSRVKISVKGEENGVEDERKIGPEYGPKSRKAEHLDGSVPGHETDRTGVALRAREKKVKNLGGPVVFLGLVG